MVAKLASASVGIVDVDVALLGILTSNKSDAVSQGLSGLELELDLSLGDDRRDELCDLAGFDQVRKEGIDVANWEPPHALSHGTALEFHSQHIPPILKC